MPVAAKICGVKTPEAVDVAIEHGARWIGLNFFAPSPRALSPEAAKPLAERLPTDVQSVAVLVDPDDTLLDQIAPVVDILQLHGEESPMRLAEIAARWTKPLWKAVPVAEPADLDRAYGYRELVEAILFDAKPPPGAPLPGGTGLSYDPSLLKDVGIDRPWLLSGGLTVATVADAVHRSGAEAVDVSSGVEKQRGEKDLDLIRAFLNAAKAL